jgi:hypothetical protein
MKMIRTLRQPFELFDETLDINATDNYDLTVELSADGLVFSVLDLLRGKYVMLRHYQASHKSDDNTFSLSDALWYDDFLKRSYRKVIALTPVAESTLVPGSLYDGSVKESYYRFNQPSDDNEVIVSNNISIPGATVVFSPDKEISDLIESKWKGVSPWHHSKPLLQHAFAVDRSSEDGYIHLHVENGFITIVILSNHNLAFCNNFICSTPSDICYFLFNILDNRGIKKIESIYLSGIVQPYGELHLSLLEFTHAVHFASPHVKQGFSYVFNDVHLHRYLNLFTAASCE